MSSDSDESEYEIYRVGVHGAQPIRFVDLDTAQEYAEEQLDIDYDTIVWRFDSDDANLMHGVVEDFSEDSYREFAAVEIKREYLFDDVETAAKWAEKRERKGWK